MDIVVPSPPSLSALYGQDEARVVDLFDAWNVDLPENLQAINRKICEAFITQHGRARLRVLFKMPRTQAAQVLTENGAGEGWIDTMEALSGFKFAPLAVPTTEKLVRLSGGDAAPTRPSKGNKYQRTLSDDVEESALGFASELIPDAVFDAVTRVKSPQTDTLEVKDMSDFTDALLVWVAARYNAWNLGLPLARHYARQAALRFPNLPETKLREAKGRQGDVEQRVHGAWTTAIMNKSRNRSFVRPCPQTQRISSSYPVPQPVLLSLWQKSYAKPLVINAIDIADTEAFGNSILMSRVKVDDNPKEQKYVPRQDARGVPSAEASPAALPTPDDGALDYDSMSVTGEMTPTASPHKTGTEDRPLNLGSGMLVPASLGGGPHTGRAPSPLGEQNAPRTEEAKAATPVPEKRPKKAKAAPQQANQLSEYELKRLATPDPNHDLDPDPSPNSIPNPNQEPQHAGEPSAPGRA